MGNTERLSTALADRYRIEHGRHISCQPSDLEFIDAHI